MSAECRLCGRRASDSFCCATCATAARENLTRIADLAAHLDGKRARIRSNWTTGTIGRTAVLHLPYDPRVTVVAEPIRIGLHGTARIIGDTTNQASGPTCQTCSHPSCARLRVSSWPPDDSLAGTARWLVSWCEWLRRRDVGPEEFASFEQAKNALVALFDNPPSRLYLGRCGPEKAGCPASLYVEADEDNKPAAATVSCPLCLAVHQVGLRQDLLAAGVGDYLGTSAEISALCRHMLGDDVSPAMIRGYAHRGTIAAKGTRIVATRAGPRTADLYQIGDVQRAAADARGRAQTRLDIRRAHQSEARHAALRGQ